MLIKAPNESDRLYILARNLRREMLVLLNATGCGWGFYETQDLNSYKPIKTMGTWPDTSAGLWLVSATLAPELDLPPAQRRTLEIAYKHAKGIKEYYVNDYDLLESMMMVLLMSLRHPHHMGELRIEE